MILLISDKNTKKKKYKYLDLDKRIMTFLKT